MKVNLSVDEMKNYLRVDFEDDDVLLKQMIRSAEKTCMDILRVEDEDDLYEVENGKLAVMFTVAYLYENREEADHSKLALTLRALLFGNREVQF